MAFMDVLVWVDSKGMKSHNAENYVESLSVQKRPRSKTFEQECCGIRGHMASRRVPASLRSPPPYEGKRADAASYRCSAFGRAIQMPKRIRAPPRLWTRVSSSPRISQPNRPLQWPPGRSRGTRRPPAAARARWPEALASGMADEDMARSAAMPCSVCGITRVSNRSAMTRRMAVVISPASNVTRAAPAVLRARSTARKYRPKKKAVASP